MQHYCRKCHHVYHNSIENCPNCKEPQDALIAVSEDLGEALAKVLVNKPVTKEMMKRFTEQQKLNDKMIDTMNKMSKILNMSANQIVDAKKRLKVVEMNLGL